MMSPNKPISAQEYLNTLGNLNEQRNKRIKEAHSDLVNELAQINEDFDREHRYLWKRRFPTTNMGYAIKRYVRQYKGTQHDNTKE